MRVGRFRVVVWLAVLAVAGSVSAQDRRLARPAQTSERRVALVIGNDVYRSMPLTNAVNDARAVHAVLSQLGFESTLVVDASFRDLSRGIERFVSSLREGDVALVFYAGHGIQIDGENYLVPIDFDAKDEADAKYLAYSAARLHDRMSAAGVRAKLLFLDACRNNPFRVSRSASGGLAPMAPVGRGTFIVFATGPGSVATDSSAAPNSLFTTHLLAALKTPGLTILQVYSQVSEAVDRASNGRQTPWMNSSLIGELVLNRTSRSAGTAPRIRAAELTPTPPSATPASPGSTSARSPSDLDRACKGGDAAACTNLGVIYAIGRGVAMDVSRAVALYQKGCDGGNGAGCTNLGYMYESGEGLAKDVARATALFQRACDGNNARGCNRLGQYSLLGSRGPKDPRRAMTLFQKACDLGIDWSAVGCSNLGHMFEDGTGVPIDVGRAAALYDRSCSLAHPSAGSGCSDLARMYAEGKGGLPRSDARAKELYKKSCDLGHTAGCAAK
jgi:TPR repeat protein